MFGGFYNRKRILVTGHTGFKGSWLCQWLEMLGAEVTGIALGPPTVPSHWDVLRLQGTADIRLDLRERELLAKKISHLSPEIVFHLAARSLVSEGYSDPHQTFSTNVIGTVNLLEALRASDCAATVVIATTDKVYAEPAQPSGYSEADRLGASDPYSTSKACAELVAACYARLMNACSIATARAGNVIGGGDWSANRLIPDLVSAARSGGVLRVRQLGAVRPWQHVLEPLAGYLELARALGQGETPTESCWNFGPPIESFQSVAFILEKMKSHFPHITIQAACEPSFREAAILTLNSQKAMQQLTWKPVWSLEESIARTASWYVRYFESGVSCSAQDLEQFVRDASFAGLGWAK